MDVAHVASAVVYMASLPLDANVLFLTVMSLNYLGDVISQRLNVRESVL